MEVFAKIGAKDPHFKLEYRVQPDNEGMIKNLMWASGSNMLQYTFFGDIITFGTTYRPNLYDMPSAYLLVSIIISRMSCWLGCLYMMSPQRVLNGVSLNF